MTEMLQLQQHPQVEDVQTFDKCEASSVKTYKRVEGATLVSEAKSGETVTRQVELTAGSSDQTFTYTQETTTSEDSSYELTVPYPTEEGYTDSDLLAEGDYTVTAGEETTTSEVPEEAVYAGETVEVDGETATDGGSIDDE